MKRTPAYIFALASSLALSATMAQEVSAAETQINDQVQQEAVTTNQSKPADNDLSASDQAALDQARDLIAQVAAEQTGQEVRNTNASAEALDQNSVTDDGQDSESSVAGSTEPNLISSQDQAASDQSVTSGEQKTILADNGKQSPIKVNDQVEIKNTSVAAKVSADQLADLDRIQGRDRFEVAAKASQLGWDKSDTILLANGYKGADVLTGTPLAHAHDMPILYTKDTWIPEVTLQEMRRLQVKHVVLLGAQASVSDKVAEQLLALDYQVSRIGGKNRYEQSVLIARQMEKVTGKPKQAFLVNGYKFADALSIATAAANMQAPIYLTKGDQLADEIIPALDQIGQLTIIGSQASVSDQVVKQAQNLGAKVDRIPGKNRYQVNRNILKKYHGNQPVLYVASGEIFSDALPAGNLAAKHGHAVLLVKDENVYNVKEQVEYALSQDVKTYLFFGGTKTLGTKTAQWFKQPQAFLDQIKANEAAAAEAKRLEAERKAQAAKASKTVTVGKTNSSFLNKLIVPAMELAHENGLYASVMMAQAALESGWGTSLLSREPNHNLFGIKGAYQGQSVNMQTLEDSGGRNYYSIRANFRKYPSYRESLQDYTNLLKNGLTSNQRFYAGAWKTNTNSYQEATRYLTGRYATDSAYASKLNRIISQNNLTQYDTPKDATGKIQVVVK
ncbi:hypothetical protein AWM75_05875 [Aerococcus urinaehominis]|uniref:Uncharacterized protein n=1 Tax=Aerococcus urinaehominis TaxID=128944 RepID=A0A0X8FLR2_9LACT|nr:cell wall-binding repeat-containing protein [Aerococcus urinaehominis]AMB99552.1 hypothetical protein AWM75_05875 [Aerococcus urinaehominis]SDM34879.1 Flagellum-specific peptidoglycan hydrolase FlgJ [Aerococcus urinaehominis]